MSKEAVAAAEESTAAPVAAAAAAADDDDDDDDDDTNCDENDSSSGTIATLELSTRANSSKHSTSLTAYTSPSSSAAPTARCCVRATEKQNVAEFKASSGTTVKIRVSSLTMPGLDAKH